MHEDHKTNGLDSVVFEHAGFGKRLLAYLVDAIILFIAGVMLAVILGQGAESDVGSLIIAWLYFATMESSDRMGTFGKNAIGIKVTDTNGNKINFGQATLRYFAKLLSAFILLIGFIMILFTKNQQGLHDLIAKTYVVKA